MAKKNNQYATYKDAGFKSRKEYRKFLFSAKKPIRERESIMITEDKVFIPANEQETTTNSVKRHMRTQKWFCGKLQITNNTFRVRMEKGNWKESEILALKQLKILP